MKFYGELLIFVLLTLTNGRVFFVKHTRRDPLVSLAPLCFILSIFQCLSWRIDLLTLYAFLLSTLILLTNFHALIRFTSNLYIDHYSFLMKFWAGITITLSVAGIIFTIIFTPIEISAKKIGVTESEFKFEGSFKSGLVEASPISKTTGFLYEYSMFPELTGRRNVVVFISDKRGDTYNYRPYLKLLAKKGLTCCSADFYTSDSLWLHSLLDSKYLRKTSMNFSYFMNPLKFVSQREFYTYNIKKELDNLMPVLVEKYGPQCKFFLVSDVMGNSAISDFKQSHPDLISGTLFLDSIEGYDTPGFGFVEQTDPFTHFLLTKKLKCNTKNLNHIVSASSDIIKGEILKK